MSQGAIPRSSKNTGPPEEELLNTASNIKKKSRRRKKRANTDVSDNVAEEECTQQNQQQEEELFHPDLYNLEIVPEKIVPNTFLNKVLWGCPEINYKSSTYLINRDLNNQTLLLLNSNINERPESIICVPAVSWLFVEYQLNCYVAQILQNYMIHAVTVSSYIFFPNCKMYTDTVNEFVSTRMRDLQYDFSI